MARIIPQRDIVKKNIESFSDRTTDFYSRWFEGAPTYVTYYKKNNLKSTQDIHLEDVKEVVGSESPILFDRIEDFTLYGFQESTPENLIEDYGLDWELDSEAVILPGTIKPAPDDFFVINYNGEDNLFRVTDIIIDRINGKPFYRISYSWASELKSEIEEQVEDEYIFSYENLGTEDKVILPKKDYFIAENIDKYIERLYKIYIELFLDPKLNLLYVKHNQYRLYNRYLIRFIRDNKILDRRYNFMSSVVINDALGNLSYETDPMYYKTIYGVIESMELEDFTLEDFKPFEICDYDPTIAFYYDYNVYHVCNYNMSYNNIGEDPRIIKPHKGSLATKVKMNEYFCDKFNNDLIFIENIIIKYLNKDLSNEELLNRIDNISLTPTLNIFLLLPIVIYILKERYSELVGGEEIPKIIN